MATFTLNLCSGIIIMIVILLLLLFLFIYRSLWRHNRNVLPVLQQLLSILDVSKIIVWSYDVEKKCFFFMRQLSESPERVSYDRFIAMVHPEHREECRNVFALVENGQMERTEQKLRLIREGEYEWFKLYLIPVKSEKPQKVTQIIGTQKSIMESVKKQEELKEIIYKLKLVVGFAEVTPWEYNVESSSFRSPEPGMFNLPEITFDEMLLSILEADRELWENAFSAILQGKENSLDVRIRVKRPGKEQINLAIYAIVFRKDDKGLPVRILGVSKDVTSSFALEEQTELRKRAENANWLKSVFLVNTAHEIQAPLNAIVSFSSLIVESNDPKEQLHFKEVVDKNNKLLLHIMHDIFDFEKFEAKVTKSDYSIVELPELFSEVFYQFKRKMPRGVTFRYDLPDEKCSIRTDENRLIRILSKILSNACKDSSEREIVMGYVQMAGKIRFFIRDTIRNILQKAQGVDLNMERFTRGAGLGLAICRSLIEEMGGEIGTDLLVDGSTEYWFTLPGMPPAEIPEEEGTIEPVRPVFY